jgi:hypothetical protein
MKRLTIYFLLILIISSCASKTAKYNSEYALTKRKIVSDKTSLQVNLPVGWFATEPDAETLIDLWLIKDDYSASIIFLPINFDDETFPDDQFTIENVFDLVKLKSEAEGNMIVSPKDSLVIDKTTILAFEFTNIRQEQFRTIVFKSGGNYFQCTAGVLNKAASVPEIFSVQNSVLKSAVISN